MGQLSFFSAETDEPAIDDLSGLLAASGQTVESRSGVRLSVVVDAVWRAEALVAEMRLCGVAAEVARSDEGSPLARTEATAALRALDLAWSRGAVKSMPAGWIPSPRAQRCWLLASGRPEGDHYLLGLDPHAPDTHPVLATALMRAGVAPTLVGTRGNTPALRITGRRRLTRLLENVGAPPDSADAVALWPHA